MWDARGDRKVHANYLEVNLCLGHPKRKFDYTINDQSIVHFHRKLLCIIGMD
jgi:hypothetical protein